MPSRIEDEESWDTCELTDKLIIGLDFGTTFSGIAYALTGTEKPEVFSITDWPGLEGRAEPKVQTVISYDLQNSNEFRWGADDHVWPQIVAMKLLLDPEQDRPLYLPSGRVQSKLKNLPKPPVEIATDFMRSIYQHAMARIETKVLPDYLKFCKREFIISVPAVWSERAKSQTLQAARAAGLSPVSLIKEPQAAALYTLFKTQNKALSVGDVFTVCDAGGGTVDLISYEIESLDPQLRLKEIVPSKGGMAGSLGLNERFVEALRELVGDEKFVELKKTDGYRKALEEFDKSIKKAYRGDDEKTYYVNFPKVTLDDDPDNGLEANTWTMTGADLKKIFAPLMMDIYKLVEEQVKEVRLKRCQADRTSQDGVKAVMLVGGFGSSQYLREYLKEKLSDVIVIQPDDAWAAIVKGAVMDKLPKHAFVSSSIALRHLGTSANAIPDTEEDQLQKKSWDAAEGVNRINTWFIHQGDDLRRERRIEYPFYRITLADYKKSKLRFEDKLLQCETPTPARYPVEGITKVRCTLKTDFTNVDHSLFRPFRGVDGKDYVKIYYNLVVEADPALLKFSLEFDGQTVGSVEDVWD